LRRHDIAYYNFEGHWQGWIRSDDQHEEDGKEDESDAITAEDKEIMNIEEARTICMEELLLSKK
jgi:hypothetical protein